MDFRDLLAGDEVGAEGVSGLRGWEGPARDREGVGTRRGLEVLF